MATSVAEQLVEDLRDSGVQRIYGLVVTREEIMAAAHSPERYSSVRELMKTNVPTISSEADLFEEALPILQQSGLRALPVTENAELVGMLTIEDVGQARLLRQPSRK
jgi:CBS domain-containing protein